MPFTQPRAMAYSRQAIICMVSGLMPIATGLQRKRDTAGDGTRSAIFQGPLISRIPAEYCSAGSRLIVVAHGVVEGTHLVADGGLTFDGRGFAVRLAGHRQLVAFGSSALAN